jgi:carbonic anhydrase
MSTLASHRDRFLHGLRTRAGWSAEAAEACFDDATARFAIDDPIANVRAQTARLRERFPRMLVAPLFFAVREGRLLQVRE